MSFNEPTKFPIAVLTPLTITTFSSKFKPLNFVARYYLPLNTGFLFSMKAETPSCKSSVEPTTLKPSRSKAIAVFPPHPGIKPMFIYAQQLFISFKRIVHRRVLVVFTSDRD